MRRVLPNILLLLMLFFLVPVYQANQSPPVLILGVLLLTAGLLLGYTNQPRGLEILAGLALILSFIGVVFWGRIVTGSLNGGYCFVGLWILVLIGVAAVFYQRAVFVERGQILVLNVLPESRVLVWTEGLHRPLKPFVERRMAALPAYELTTEPTINQLNTKSLYNINQVKLLVRYKVAQPRDVVFNFPNREQAFENLAREREQLDDTDTDEQVAFWSELIRRQMAIEIDQSVRTVIANIQAPIEVAQNRETHAKSIHRRLQASVARWGIEVLELRLLDVMLDPERIKMAFRDKIIERERRDAQRKAEIRAEEVRLVGQAQAEATALMVAEMVKALQQQGTSLATSEIERIVITAMQRMSDQEQLSGFFREVAQSSQPGTPATGQTTALNPNQANPQPPRS